MLPVEKQRELAQRYLLIEDSQERLALLMDRGRKIESFSESDRSDGQRVQGCVSRVWLICELDEAGGLRLRVDADSALVKALAAVICEVYAGSLPSEAAEFETTILEALHLANQLSPTRQHGLKQVGRTIRDFAKRSAGGDAAP